MLWYTNFSLLEVCLEGGEEGVSVKFCFFSLHIVESSLWLCFAASAFFGVYITAFIWVIFFSFGEVRAWQGGNRLFMCHSLPWILRLKGSFGQCRIWCFQIWDCCLIFCNRVGVVLLLYLTSGSGDWRRIGFFFTCLWPMSYFQSLARFSS